MPKLTIDGKEIEVAPGTNLIEAARQVGVDVPHYCYHPGLSIAGQCRLCMVDIEKNPRPQIACNTVAADGMVVHTQTERVLETRRSIMEFHLINHPLDCPVCDQAGECWLQIYYMQHGLYEPRMADDKVKKPKAVPLGQHVILDAERCILCSRCVRFCDEVSKTGELGIMNRGDHSEIALFPGTTLDNPYSGNVIDICPVGALTDRDFRFQVRVWYLDATRSVCPGCARGCNTEIHTSRSRPHHNQGRRIARLKPRHNPDVNQWWMCDEGRYGFRDVDAESRLTAPATRADGRPVETTWDEALAALEAAIRRRGPDEIGVIASPDMSNEDLYLLGRLVRHLGVRQVAFRVPPRVPGRDDDFLIRADKHPNTRGAELTLPADGPDARAILAAAAAGRITPAVGVPPRPHRVRLARGRGARGSRRRRDAGVPGHERQRRQRGGAPRAAERGLCRARRDGHQLPGPGAAVPRGARAARRGAARLGGAGPRGARARRRRCRLRRGARGPRVPGAGRRRRRVRGHELPRPRRSRPGGEGMSRAPGSARARR